ncbi:tRNA pseudouridine(38-40) synthase TruA [Candidatus Latescibacterota bacterium]
MKERTFRLVVEYDGTGFAGWQVQPSQRTVQQEIETALEKILRHPVRVVAAGRTDAGVHAVGQTINFKTTSNIEISRMRKAINSILPRDVTILDAVETDPGFNARYDALSRTYRYTLSDRRLSVGRLYAWQPKYKLSRELLIEATRPLDGMCSLEGFSKKNDKDDYSTIIFENCWTFKDNLMIFEIKAVRFFHNAVRGIVGSAVEVARGKEPPDLLRRILDTKDRSIAGPVAPPHGLSLVNVEYGEGIK